MDLPAAISAITASIGLARELKNIDASFDKAELKLKVAELTAALAEAKLGLVDVASQLQEKDDEISQLRKTIETKELHLKQIGNNTYFTVGGIPKGAPICPVCEKKGLFLQMVQTLKPGRTYACPHCKADYGPFPGYIK
ncbi:MAG: hypothetical protein ACK4IA_16400 [Paracoccus hibiscisoli]|uniref:hypothetical protein n=1 Tax=Paracoccus hibiscisoli TaxID=2023261 RepID=UPI00391B57F5